MAEAVDVLVTNGKDTGRVACRVMYRLAHQADTLYQGIVAQKQSSEWSTAQAVIKQKRQQVGPLHASACSACVAHAEDSMLRVCVESCCNVCQQVCVWLAEHEHHTMSCCTHLPRLTDTGFADVCCCC